jgi:acyl carrier protein
MNQINREAPLLDFVKDELLRGRKPDLKADEDLLSTGIIDSLGILRLVSFIEERFGVQVPDQDVVYENFNNIKVLSEYLEKQ